MANRIVQCWQNSTSKGDEMKYNDFSELIETIKAMSEEEKRGLTIYEDEGIVRVLDAEEDTIFSADALNFVHAFFVLLGVDIDDNISIRAEHDEEKDEME